MILEILSKISSELLLSLYPVFVKFINLPIGIQMWCRFLTYMVISSFFVNWNFIIKTIFTKYGLSLIIVTLIHVYTSYRGFQLLDSGIAYVIFYTYPLIILIMSGEKISAFMFMTIIGIYILSQQNNDTKIVNTENENKTFGYEGIFMMIIAAFTEALIYFIVRNIKTDNNWNHLFISYAFGALILTIYYYKDIKLFEGFTEKNINNNGISLISNTKIFLSLLINSIIGLFGYLLRFYAVSRLKPNIYAPLSYIGILSAYLYGIIFYNNKINLKTIIGTILIIIPNLFISSNYLTK